MLKRIIFLILIFSFLVSLHKETKCNGAVILIGGGSCSQAIQWMLNKTNNNKLLILSNDEEMMYWVPAWQDKAQIELLVVPSREVANQDETIQKIESSQAILISGGDQQDYIRLWKGTRLAKAINKAALSKVVAGTSAGLAIMGEYYYSAFAGTVLSEEALANPYNEYVSNIESGFLSLPYMKGIITDSHYTERHRYGRLLAFLARILCDNKFSRIKGIGIDEGCSVCIDSNGNAIVLGKGNCYLIENLSFPEKCIMGYFLVWENAVKVKILKNGDKFDFKKWNFKNCEIWSVADGKLIR